MRHDAAINSSDDWKIWLDPSVIRARAWSKKNFELTIMLSAFLAMYFAYVIVFWIAQGESLSLSARAGLRNIGAIIPIALVVRYLVRGPLKRLSFPLKLASHVLFACLVSLSWYTLVLILVNWSSDWLQTGISVLPFSSKATFWHLKQGLVVYAGLVAATYAFQLREELDALRARTAKLAGEAGSTKGIIFAKSGDEWVKVDHQDIACISADNDSVIIRTRHRKFRSSRNLKDLDKALADHGFVRVHRSHLVNLVMVRSAEPTGDGRLTLHLADNASITTSRAGAKRFRARIAI